MTKLSTKDNICLLFLKKIILNKLKNPNKITGINNFLIYS